jgi:hypothetical protein
MGDMVPFNEIDNIIVNMRNYSCRSKPYCGNWRWDKGSWEYNTKLYHEIVHAEKRIPKYDITTEPVEWENDNTNLYHYIKETLESISSYPNPLFDSPNMLYVCNKYIKR